MKIKELLTINEDGRVITVGDKVNLGKVELQAGIAVFKPNKYQLTVDEVEELSGKMRRMER